MGVYIPNMEMPKDCMDCPLFESKYHFHGCHAVPQSFNDMDMWYFVGDRPSWCPLIEVPPHGRLIDADSLINKLQAFYDKRSDEARYTGSRGIKVSWDDAVYQIFDAPTIIEAEDKDD